MVNKFQGDGECQSTQDLVVELEKITINFNNTGTDVNVTQNLEFRDNAITLEYCFYKTVSPQGKYVILLIIDPLPDLKNSSLSKLQITIQNMAQILRFAF